MSFKLLANYSVKMKRTCVYLNRLYTTTKKETGRFSKGSGNLNGEVCYFQEQH